jgi:hypothetical protein
MLSGCTESDVIRVGTPFSDEGREGVVFDHEITEEEALDRLRTVIEKEESIDEASVTGDADVYFQLERPEEGISEIARYVWFQEDGSAVLSGLMDEYSTLTEEQTLELKRILEL